MTHKRRGRPTGYKMTEASKKAISKTRTGQKQTEETKNKISRSLKKYFHENHEYAHPSIIRCERCGTKILEPRKFCDGCIEIIRAANGAKYRKTYQKLRTTKKYQEWRSEILERDKNTCKICGGEGDIVHHMVDLLELVKHEDLLYDTTIGLTLCKSCHGRLHYIDKYTGGENV